MEPAAISGGEADAFAWGDSLPHLIWRAQNAVHRGAQAAVEDLGVTVTQLGMAVHLDELGPLSASDLARGFRITPQSVTTALSRLEHIGWITRTPHPVHGRVILNTLTDAGRRGVREGRARMASLHAELEQALVEAEATGLRSDLRRLLSALEPEARPVEASWPQHR